MRQTTGKRVSVAAGLALAVLLGVTAFVYREHLRFWWEFESLGANTQGRPEYRHRETGIVFVRVPGGTFTMGSPSDEEGRFENEGPQHEVTLSPFLIAKHEVTQGVYEQVLGENPSHFDLGEDHPVESVSWNDANAFCEEVGFELPTEAQWEYACRAGTTGARYGALEDISWYSGNSGGGTQPVGQKEPNPWGLHDTLGNVWEWCSDRYGEYREGPAEDPTGPSAGENRVFRGGSWLFDAQFCRAAGRDRGSPSGSISGLGFRPARPLP